jgi:hypothetical protein
LIRYAPQCSALDIIHQESISLDNLTLRYFDAEMRYLREAGKEFAEAFPDRAAQLNLDKPGAQDPYVERLFEGFAFLMGRLREKLDDDLPELTEGLVSLLWPHYLRTIPSLSVIELRPELAQMKGSEPIGKGFEVLSQPIGPQRTRCRYTTTQDLRLQPLALESVRVAYEPDGRSLLRLRFACGVLTDWSQTDLSCLPLYLNADGPLASALHQALTLNTQALYVRSSSQQERKRLDGHFAPKGFADEDRLWPKGDSAFSGYQLLLEYFTFREKFMFVTLYGLEQLAARIQREQRARSSTCGACNQSIPAGGRSARLGLAANRLPAAAHAFTGWAHRNLFGRPGHRLQQWRAPGLCPIYKLSSQGRHAARRCTGALLPHSFEALGERLARHLADPGWRWL